jgi:hypothetical protein
MLATLLAMVFTILPALPGGDIKITDPDTGEVIYEGPAIANWDSCTSQDPLNCPDPFDCVIRDGGAGGTKVGEGKRCRRVQFEAGVVQCGCDVPDGVAANLTATVLGAVSAGIVLVFLRARRAL